MAMGSLSSVSDVGNTSEAQRVRAIPGTDSFRIRRARSCRLSSSRRWSEDVNRPFSRSRGISSCALIASSMACRASRAICDRASRLFRLRFSTSEYVKRVRFSQSNDMASLTAWRTSAGRLCVSARLSRFRLLRSAAAFSSVGYVKPFCSSRCFQSASSIDRSGNPCFCCRVARAAISRVFRGASSPTAARIRSVRLENKSTGTPSISHSPFLPVMTVSKPIASMR